MRIGERVEVRQGAAWLLGLIVATVERAGRVRSVKVKLDQSGRVVTVDPSRVEVV